MVPLPPHRYVAIADGNAITFAQHAGDMLQPLDRAPWLGGRPSGLPRSHAGVTLACPVRPTKILGAVGNYPEHVKEKGKQNPTDPVFFLKPPSSLLGPGGTILIPNGASRVEHEVELGVIIGRRCRNVPADDALNCVFGYTVVCDVSDRALQESEPLWTRGKGFDTYCPAGPAVVTGLNAQNRALQRLRTQEKPP